MPNKLFAIIVFLLAASTLKSQTSELPVMKLTGTFGYDYQDATITLIMPDSTTTENISAKIKWRGGTTNIEGKHKRNYKIKLSEDRQLLGLRTDNKWILDAGQADVFRLRNRIATDLWNDMARKPYYADQKPNARSGVRGRVVEVYLNEEYRGIYCLTECMDRKQMKIEKIDTVTRQIRGGMWKAKGYGNSLMWTVTQYDNRSSVWDTFEVIYPDLDDIEETDYSTLYNAINFVVNSSDEDFILHVSEYFDMPVIIDYYIFIYALNAFDNRGKNMYWAVFNKTHDKKLTLAVWDLDGTFGQRWIEEWIPNAISPEYDFDNNMNLYYRLSKLNVDHFNEKVSERYQQLRSTHLSTDSLISRFNSYYNLLKSNGAIEREESKWSGDTDVKGEQINFEKELLYITNWISQHMHYLDQKFTTTTHINNLSSNNSYYSQLYNLSGQRVTTKNPAPGIYIRNGKKYVIH